MDADYKKQIIDYYELCENDYRKWWQLDKTHSMHAGYWDKTTHTLEQALIKENEVLANMADITSEDTVLDAGCGVGGSSIYLALKRHCRVTGITLSAKQVESAWRYASQYTFEKPPEFFVMDFTKTSFADESFDVVWGLESVCHAEDKKEFLKEAYRILKPNGRLIIGDGFYLRQSYTASEKALLDKVAQGWAVKALATVTDFEKDLQAVGFENIKKTDLTLNVWPSSKKLYLYSFPAVFLSRLGEYFGLSNSMRTQNFVSFHYQYQTVKDGLCGYYAFSAEKKKAPSYSA
jgi:cyclopropane fatty-acyl-phospholipid synthase-like methyltransferase